MSQHVAGGQVLCIHSVVTAPNRRKMGVANWAVKQYIRNVCSSHPELTRMALLAKEWNVGLYARCGFAMCGASDVDHGAEQWNDMQLTLGPQFSRVQQYTVDAFTSSPFAGNPAAVVLLPGHGSLPSELNPADALTKCMQALAAENNLSETAFLQRDASEPGAWTLRWFTPATEVGMCGHATLASAAALWHFGYLPHTATSVAMTSAAGKLVVTRKPSGALSMQFPAVPPQPAKPKDAAAWSALLEEATGVPVEPGVQWFTTPGLGDVIAQVSPDAFQALPATSSINMASIARIPARGVIVTSQGEQPAGEVSEDVLLQPVHFQSRFFGPRCGVSEDPVTGSAHCALGPLWIDHFGGSHSRLHAYQASARGGHVGVTWLKEEGQVLLEGSAVPTKESTLLQSIGSQLLGALDSAGAGSCK